MSTVEVDSFSVAKDLVPISFNDEAGLLITAHKGSELSNYYFSWMSEWMREALAYPFTWVGQVLRDRLYFPLTNPSEGFQWNMKMGATFYSMLTGDQEVPRTNAFPQIEEVRNAFNITTIPVQIKSDNRVYTFHIYLVESKELVNGTGLRLFLMSFYGNTVVENGEERDWKPENIVELSVAPILVLKALWKIGYQMDSLDLFSLGAVAFEGLKYLDKSETNIVPQTIILDRGISSTYKVGKKLYSFPISYLLFGIAYLSNWSTDPEKACLQFFERMPSLQGRMIVQIQAVKDCYFSGVGAYSPNFLQRLSDLGMETFYGNFYPPCYKEASHHALPRSLLYNNPDSGTFTEGFIEMKPLETLADALMREVFSNPERTAHLYHQSLVLGGNAENLDIVLMRMYSMMCAFLDQKKDHSSILDEND